MVDTIIQKLATATDPRLARNLPPPKPVMFDGNLLEWKYWYANHTALIIAHPEMKLIHKYDLLMQQPTGKAHEKAKNCTYSDQSYNTAIEKLREEFGETGTILKKLNDEMHNLPKVNGDSDVKGLYIISKY